MSFWQFIFILLAALALFLTSSDASFIDFNGNIVCEGEKWNDRWCVGVKFRQTQLYVFHTEYGAKYYCGTSKNFTFNFWEDLGGDGFLDDVHEFYIVIYHNCTSTAKPFFGQFSRSYTLQYEVSTTDDLTTIKTEIDVHNVGWLNWWAKPDFVFARWHAMGPFAA